MEYSPYSPNQQLLDAAITGDWPSIQQALQNGEDINTARGYDGLCLWGLTLHMAMYNAHWEVVDRLLDEVPGIDLEVVNEVGETPFLLASSIGNLPLVQKLHSLGCNVHYRSHYNGQTALHCAFADGYHNDVAEYLLVHCDCDPNITDEDGVTPLEWACSGDDDETIHGVVSLFLEKGADPSLGYPVREHVASAHANVRTLRLLLDRGARIEAKPPYRVTALHRFAEMFRGDQARGIQVFEELIGRGANILDRDSRDNTPWDLAHRNRKPENCSLLLTAYVDQVLAQHGNLAGHAILRAAVYQDFTQEQEIRVPLHPLKVRLPVGTLPFHVFRTLLESLDPSRIRSVDPNTGSLPIHLAVRQNAPLDILRLLVELDPASLRHMNNDGEFPVHLACSLGETAELNTLQFLVDRGGRMTLEIANRHGTLPLHCLLEARPAWNTVEFLLEEFPRSVKAKTHEGDLPYAVARNASCDKNVMFLLLRTYPEALFHYKLQMLHRM